MNVLEMKHTRSVLIHLPFISDLAATSKSFMIAGCNYTHMICTDTASLRVGDGRYSITAIEQQLGRIVHTVGLGLLLLDTVSADRC